MNFSIECEEEVDGRWIAEIPQLPGVLCYGGTRDEAMVKVEALALCAMAERLEHAERSSNARSYREAHGRYS